MCGQLELDRSLELGMVVFASRIVVWAKPEGGQGASRARLSRFAPWPFSVPASAPHRQELEDVGMHPLVDTAPAPVTPPDRIRKRVPSPPAEETAVPMP
eukprot:8820250-Alexandrium_andersonii.AAC.1